MQVLVLKVDEIVYVNVMKKIKENKIKELTSDYRRTLKELRLFRDDCLKQLDNNPFIQKEWTFLDKLYFKITAGFVPPTPYEELIDITWDRFYQNTNQLVDNYMSKVEIVRKWKCDEK